MTTLPRASTVPAVIDAIVAAFGSIVDADLTVQDGPQPKPAKRKCIAVGVGREAVRESIVRDVRAGGWVYSESYDVVCVMWSWSGKKLGLTPKQLRDECGDLLAEVRTQIDALNAANAAQGISFWFGEDGGWVQSYSGEGRACEKAFSVHVTATI